MLSAPSARRRWTFSAKQWCRRIPGQREMKASFLSLSITSSSTGACGNQGTGCSVLYNQAPRPQSRDFSTQGSRQGMDWGQEVSFWNPHGAAGTQHYICMCILACSSPCHPALRSAAPIMFFPCWLFQQDPVPPKALGGTQVLQTWPGHCWAASAELGEGSCGATTICIHSFHPQRDAIEGQS